MSIHQETYVSGKTGSMAVWARYFVRSHGPEACRKVVARIERHHRSLGYRLFRSRARKAADRRQLDALKEALA